jgi:tetratricopeptide (TPR) repeat protein
MTCSRCQHKNPADAAFCQECGTRLETTCPSCATQNQLGAKFCKKCGQRLSRPEAAHAAPGPRFGSAESYTPKHLAEKILTSKAALEGGAVGSMGQQAKAAEHAREARLLAETWGDERRLGRALGRLAVHNWMAGDPDSALELAQRGLVLATAHGDVPLHAETALRLGAIGQTIGNYRRATEYLGRVAEALQGDRQYERLGTGVLISVFAQDRLALVPR